MSSEEASSNRVNDEIIRLFLYGQQDPLSSYADENLIRPGNTRP